MTYRQTPKRQRGFTIVELMVASMVFAIILLVITSGVVRFTASYYKGVNSWSTQTTARNVADLLAQEVEYGKGGAYNWILNGGTVGSDQSKCIGNIQIDYKLGSQLGKPGNVYGVFVSSRSPTDTTCPIYSSGMTGKELLGTNMRVTELEVLPITSGQRTVFTIRVGVAYGDTDLLCTTSVAPNAAGGCNPTAGALPGGWDDNFGKTITCKSGAGSQFCAFSHLSTQVTSRF